MRAACFLALFVVALAGLGSVGQNPTASTTDSTTPAATPDPPAPLPSPSTSDTVKNIYGPFPQGYLKLVKGNFNVEIGALPTLIGAEYTFSFQNMNVERGLLWNQENAVNRGIQLGWTHKKLTTAFSWNDGFYSNRYTWFVGSLAYAFNSANTLAFVAGGHAREYAKRTLATPLYLNNSQMYNLIYPYSP